MFEVRKIVFFNVCFRVGRKVDSFQRSNTKYTFTQAMRKHRATEWDRENGPMHANKQTNDEPSCTNLQIPRAKYYTSYVFATFRNHMRADTDTDVSNIHILCLLLAKWLQTWQTWWKSFGSSKCHTKRDKNFYPMIPIRLCIQPSNIYTFCMAICFCVAHFSHFLISRLGWIVPFSLRFSSLLKESRSKTIQWLKKYWLVFFFVGLNWQSTDIERWKIQFTLKCDVFHHTSVNM